MVNVDMGSAGPDNIPYLIFGIDVTVIKERWKICRRTRHSTIGTYSCSQISEANVNSYVISSTSAS